MGQEQHPSARIGLKPEELVREVDSLQELFDTKVLQSPVFMRALSMSLDEDTMDFNQGGGTLRFGDEKTRWVITKGDSSQGMVRGLARETDEEMVGGSFGRENYPPTSVITFLREKEGSEEEPEEDKDSNTAVSSIRELIADFTQYSLTQLSVYATPTIRR